MKLTKISKFTKIIIIILLLISFFSKEVFGAIPPIPSEGPNENYFNALITEYTGTYLFGENDGRYSASKWMEEYKTYINNGEEEINAIRKTIESLFPDIESSGIDLIIKDIESTSNPDGIKGVEYQDVMDYLKEQKGDDYARPSNATKVQNRYWEILEEQAAEKGLSFDSYYNSLSQEELYGILDQALRESSPDLIDEDPFGKFIDGIAGIIFIGIKIMPAAIGNILSNIMNGISGEKITVYNVLFNKIELTDINFFNNSSNNSTIMTIRNNVAIWYVGIRNLAAVVLAIILIYVAIRMAISTVADEKAKYKTMIIDWLTSLCLLFVLHYIMIFTININNTLVSVLEQASTGGIDLTEVENKLFADSFSLGFIEGLGNSIAYMMLIGMSFIFFFAYIKRMITLAFLIIISPLITITYSIDKMGDGKSQALNTWLKEFVYNILIQPFQCIIYLSLVNSVLNLLVNNGVGSVSLINVFIAVYVLMFMYQAEDIVKNIFGFKAESMGKTIASAAITGAIISRGAGLFKGGNDKKKVGAPSQYQRRPTKPETSSSQNKSSSVEQQGDNGRNQNNGNEKSTGDSEGLYNGLAEGGNDNSPESTSSSTSGGKGSKIAGALLGLAKFNIAAGLRVTGFSFGNSAGKIETGFAGYNLGASTSDFINKNIDKRQNKRNEELRKVAIANDIDKFQEEHGYTNTQIQQMMQDWLDGISMPDKDDHSGLELYQHLTEHRDGLEESGNSKDATREKIDRLIQDSLSGRQSRVHKNRFFGNLKEQINKKT